MNMQCMTVKGRILNDVAIAFTNFNAAIGLVSTKGKVAY